MFLDQRLSPTIAAGIFGLTCVFFIFSNALPSWVAAESSGIIEATIGLWRTCFTIADHTKCDDIQCPSASFRSNDCGQFLAARTFLTLACIISGVLTVCALMNARTSGDTNETSVKIIKALAITCLLTGILGVTIGINVTSGDGSELNSLGAAAYLGTLAIIANLGGAVVVILIK